MDSAKRDPRFVKDARESLALTQKQYAKAVGVSLSVVRAIEQEQRPIVGPACDKLWNFSVKVMEGLQDPNSEFIQNILLAAALPDRFPEKPVGWEVSPFNPESAISKAIGFHKALDSQKAYIETLEGQVKAQADTIELLKKSNNWSDIQEKVIEKQIDRLEKLEERVADLERLNALRTEAIVKTSEADEFQAAIERKKQEGGS